MTDPEATIDRLGLTNDECLALIRRYAFDARDAGHFHISLDVGDLCRALSALPVAPDPEPGTGVVNLDGIVQRVKVEWVTIMRIDPDAPGRQLYALVPLPEPDR